MFWKQYKNNNGYTMLEMVIVISIIVTMSAILYANYHDISKKGDVLRTSENLKNELRSAQLFSLNHKMYDGYVYGWGVHVDHLLNSYTVFADRDNDKVYSYPTKLLIHGTEYDSGVDFVESSMSNHVVTISGGAVQLDNMGKPDESDGYWHFDGFVGSYLNIPHDIDFNFEDQDFVIDLWFNLEVLDGSKRNLFHKGPLSESWSCYKRFDNVVACTVYDEGGGKHDVWTLMQITSGVWYHLALVRQGNSLAIYLNGEQHMITEMSGVVRNTFDDLKIGSFYNGTNNWYGIIDEFRIAKGMHDWGEGFSLPTENHTNDDESYKTVNVLPGILIGNISSQGLPSNKTSLYFSRDDFSLYDNNVEAITDTTVTISDLDGALSREIRIGSSGTVSLN